MPDALTAAMDGDEELLREFLLESAENLDLLDREFVALERDPRNEARIATIFRAIHTIKGTSGFFALERLQTLAHAGETVLARVREKGLLLDRPAITALLAMVDGVRTILRCVESTKTEGDFEVSTLVAVLEGIASGHSAAPIVVEPSLPSVIEEAPRGSAPEPAVNTVTDSSVRVDVELLDTLMNLVGELVLARNQITQFGSVQRDPALAKASQRLDSLTSELQAGIMKTRMQPMSNVWSRLPRIVRDLAEQCEKKIDITLEGGETELDRTIVEAIRDPLLHAARNAVDHGIEPLAARRAAGKPDCGQLVLRAFHEGGQVNVEITDDGAGLDVERIRARAIKRGLTTAERAAQLGERAVMRFIFEPGFSTADVVTNVSGRGVGMDVVRTNIERIGGMVDITSAPGRGTTLKLKIPLTLAIIPALIVRSGGERFAIPQINLVELVRLEGDELTRSVERLHDATLCRLREQLLPLVFLDQSLGLGSAERRSEMNIVVLQADDRQFGLVVDAIGDSEEIVVKPLGRELKAAGGAAGSVFAGATVMGDGGVALILDVLGVARRSQLLTSTRQRALTDGAADADAEARSRETVLVAAVRGGRQIVVKLAAVARIEQFDAALAQPTTMGDVVPYRNGILRLVDLGALFGAEGDSRAMGTMEVLVCRDVLAGFVVERVIDIVEAEVMPHPNRNRGLASGTVIINGQVAEVIELESALRAIDTKEAA